MSSAAWTRKGGQDPAGGLNARGRAAYKAATGGTLRPPVKSGDDPRRASFLARMGAVRGPMVKDGKPTRLALALRAWGASSKEDARKKARAISRRLRARYGENPMKNKWNSPQWRNMEKSGFRKGQFIGYGGGNVYRISRISGGYIAINQNRATDSFQGKTLSDISFELMDRDVKTNPMKKTRRNPMKRRSNPSEVLGGKSIGTKYIGPSNYRGSRIKAFVIDGNKILNSISVPFDYELDDYQRHLEAALQLRDKMNWKGDLIGVGSRDGYIFGFKSMVRAQRNPAKRKIKAVGRQSQATGRAPDKRLLRRRKKTVAGPRGFFANPVHTFKVLTRSKASAPFALVGSFKDKSRAMQYARAIHKAAPTSLSVKVTN